MANFQIGDLISFTYPAPAPNPENTKAHDRFPKVLVLHPGYIGDKSRYPLTYGINFNYLSDSEVNILRMILNPAFKDEYYDDLQRTNYSAAKQFDMVMRSAENAVITSPEHFYYTVIKPFIRTLHYDPYRLYRPDKMRNVRIAQSARVMMGEVAMTPGTTLGGRLPQQPLKPLSPVTMSGIPRLNVFQAYKQKFEHARGSRFNLRLPVFEKFRNKNKKK